MGLDRLRFTQIVGTHSNINIDLFGLKTKVKMKFLARILYLVGCGMVPLKVLLET